MSGDPVIVVTGFWTAWGTDPAPTVFSVLAGTRVPSRAPLGGGGVPVARPGSAGVAGEPSDLTTIKATTMTTTASTLPPVMNRRLRVSARRSASRCAAIFSRAVRCLVLVALLIASPQECLPGPSAAVHRRARRDWVGPRRRPLPPAPPSVPPCPPRAPPG